MPLISPPAQNALPRPVSTSDRIALSLVTAWSASTNSERMSSLMALRRSGLLRAIVATPASTENSMS